MLRKVIFFAMVVALFHVTTALATTAQKAWFCQTCASTSDAENFVIAQAEALNAGGDRTIEVVNLNTASTWFIEYEYFPRDSPSPLIDSAAPGTAKDNVVAGTLIAAEEKAVVIVISPKTQWSAYYDKYGFESLSDWEPELLYPLAQEAWLQANANLSEVQKDPEYEMLEAAIEYFFGHGPVITVVFSDGSTAKFELDPLQPDVIKLEDGSGRHADGTFYSFGGGGSDGDPYHVPTSNGGFNLNYTDEYWSCSIAYEDSNPYYVCSDVF